jgi:hypothetical protein
MKEAKEYKDSAHRISGGFSVWVFSASKKPNPDTTPYISFSARVAQFLTYWGNDTMGLLPFLERAIAATLWTLGAGAVAIVIGLVIGSHGAATRAEGVALGLWYGQLIAVGLCPVVLWWRVYQTMWLRGPRRSAGVRKPSIEASTTTVLVREPPVKARSKPQTKPEEPVEKAAKPRPKREPRVSREPTL